MQEATHTIEALTVTDDKMDGHVIGVVIQGGVIHAVDISSRNRRPDMPGHPLEYRWSVMTGKRVGKNYSNWDEVSLSSLLKIN